MPLQTRYLFCAVMDVAPVREGLFNMLPLNTPEVFISTAHEKFDGAGRLVDETARRGIQGLRAALATWARRLTPE